MRVGIVFFLLWISVLLRAQPEAPVLICVSVNNSGSVTINWLPPPAIPPDFLSYDIYFAPDQITAFTKLISIADSNQLSYTDPLANAGAAPRFYYVIIAAAAGSSLPSDTLETIFIVVTTADFENATITWNPIHNPPLPSMDDWYFLYREYPPGTWTLTDSTRNLSAFNHFGLCNKQHDIINYRVRQKDITGSCESVSSTDGELLGNQAQPDIPLIDSVSIDAAGNIVIGWDPSDSLDTQGYIIYQVTATNDSIDYVDGRLSSSYLHTSVNPCSTSYSYAIAAIDSCGNKSPGTFEKPQNTILLQDISYDPCQMADTIRWNEYINFSPSTGGYKVFVSENLGPYQLLATLSPGQTEYVHENLLSNTNYTYFIRAFSSDNAKSSSSCRKSIVTFNSPKPSFMYIRYVTVENNQYVRLLFKTDTVAFVYDYPVMRSEDPSGPYSQVGTVTPVGVSNLEYIDQTADFTHKSYYYQVAVIDSCKNESVIANTVRTIFLTVISTPDLVNMLSWNAYSEWSGGVNEYNVFRREGEGEALQLIATLPPGSEAYTDNSFTVGSSSYRLSYLVEAVEGSGDIYGFSEQSFSNEAIATPETRIIMPNAFIPKGANPVLKPVMIFTETDGYLFSIYNRWGQLVFQTSDPAQGWDGTLNGSYIAQDVYVYHIRYKDSSGQVNDKTGTVAVIF
jgi:gliding motility-associated-like protein